MNTRINALLAILLLLQVASIGIDAAPLVASPVAADTMTDGAHGTTQQLQKRFKCGAGWTKFGLGIAKSAMGKAGKGK